MIQPLTLFVWSRSRVEPVRISELSVTEEAFDPNLNPIRAKLSLSMRVLTVDDLGFETKGGALFLDHLAGRGAPRCDLPTRRRSRSSGSEARRDRSGPPARRPRPGCDSLPPNSRYRGVAVLARQTARRRDRRNTSRRGSRRPPRPWRVLGVHLVATGDRLDDLANRYLGDPYRHVASCRRQRGASARRR